MSERTFEELFDYALDPTVEEALLAEQSECTFIWSSKDGWPLGVIMSFVHARGRFWLTASSQRGRVSAVRRDPRVTIVVTSTGTSLGHGKSVTYRARCTVHEDAETKAWFFPALGAKRFPDDAAYREEFVRTLDSPRRVVIEVEPSERIAIDLVKMHPKAQMYGGGS
jgi:general stress protein 26